MRWIFALPLLACQEPFSNEDILFLKALPRDLSVDVPGDADTTKRGLRGAQGTPAELAKFYVDMSNTARSVNEGVFGILEIVDMVTDMPTTVRVPDRRVWGPFQPEPLEPVELILVVDRVRSSTSAQFTSKSEVLDVDSFYRYAISARSTTTATAAWEQLIGGTTILLEPDEDEATGQLIIDFEAIRRFNPDQDARGAFFVGYDFRGAREVIELRAIGPDAAVENLITDPDVTFTYFRNAEGGRFTYVAPGEGNFIYNVLVRWVPSLEGRADVEVCGPDVGPIAYYAAECWNGTFNRTWFLSNVPDFPAPFGSITSCAPTLQDDLIDAGPCK